MKRWSVLLIIREIQIKATKRYHFIPIGLTKVKNFDNTCFDQGFEERGSYILLSVDWYNLNWEQFDNIYQKCQYT